MEYILCRERFLHCGASPLLSSPDLNNNMSDKVPNKSLMRYEKKSQQMPAQSVLTFDNQTTRKYGDILISIKSNTRLESYPKKEGHTS